MSITGAETAANLQRIFDGQGLETIPQKLGKALSHHSVALVEHYPSPGNKQLDELGDPYALRYPGEKPKTSFSVVGGQVNACMSVVEDRLATFINTRVEGGEELVFSIDDFLLSLESVPMAERYPVIAFGSNANPGQLSQKFNKLKGSDREVVPTLMASVKGVVPVYAARVGINGYVFTDLYPANDSVQSRVHINFLSKAQLEAMDATEKAYSLCRIAGVELETVGSAAYETDAYLYVGREDRQGAGILVDLQERPIRLAEISVDGEDLGEQFGVMSQAEVQEYIYEIAGDSIAANLHLEKSLNNPNELIKLIINRKSDHRLDPLRGLIKELEPDQPLGRVVGREIQKAIKDTGRTAAVRGLRRKIPVGAQGIGLEDVLTLSQLRPSKDPV